MRALATILLLIIFAGPVEAAGQRKALVIGINKYTNLEQLKNARADADRIATTLMRLGFEVTLVAEAETNRNDLQLAFSTYLSSLGEGDDSVVFYSGHGVEVSGANYLVASDAPAPSKIATASALPGLLIPFADLIAQVKNRDVNANVWIIDACRNNPFKYGGRSMGGDGGLANMTNPAGTFIFYSAGAGQTALDRLITDPPTEQNSIYMREFAKMVDAYSFDELYLLARKIRPLVAKIAGLHEQRPNYNDDMDAPWCFGTCQPSSAQTELRTAALTIKDPSPSQVLDATKGLGGDDAFSVASRQIVAESEMRRREDTIRKLEQSQTEVAARISEISTSLSMAVAPDKEQRPKLEAKLEGLSERERLLRVRIGIEAGSEPLSADTVPPNAVFLGRLSAIEGCDTKNPDTRPFGCDLLRAIAEPTESRNKYAAFLNTDLRPITDVNVRLRSPSIEEKRGAVYTCVVKTVSRNDVVRLSGIINVRVSEDTFYWGTIAAPPQPCASIHRQRQ